MHRIQRALLFTFVVGTFGACSLLAQRGGIGHAPAPSSTAIGAGALSRGASATSRSSAPSIGYGYGYGYGYAGRNYSSNANRSYRQLPRTYLLAPYYYPFYDWSGATDYSAAPPADDGGYGYGPDPVAQQMMMNQAALGQQVAQLSAQLNSMMYGPQASAQQGAPAQPTAPPVTIVLRSGETLQVENYAVTDGTFWDFTQRGTRKIPISTIDLAASEKATQASGGEFPQLGGTQ